MHICCTTANRERVNVWALSTEVTRFSTEWNLNQPSMRRLFGLGTFQFHFEVVHVGLANRIRISWEVLRRWRHPSGWKVGAGRIDYVLILSARENYGPLRRAFAHTRTCCTTPAAPMAFCSCALGTRGYDSLPCAVWLRASRRGLC